MPRKKVLLVDDVHLILELEKAFLKGLPVDILVARNGAEALELVRREHPDLIYLDLNMPVMDGPTCCRALKADPATSGIPVIMVTTAGREQDELMCRASGCDDYITKPINGKLFLDKGRKCIADFERRKRRYNYSADVQFLENGEPKHGMISDISKGGLFMSVPHDSMPDDPVDLAFSIPVGGNNILVAARGRVAWENRGDDPKKPAYPAGVGVEFTDIDPAIVMMIENFFDEALNKKE
ncbi:MAG: response regulator [Geobacteraceae bacterium]|nr:response regulator [Geobacteraceae bacterium]